MTIETDFALGGKAWRIRNSKAASFEIGCILYDGAVYYGETRYDATIASECFPTKEALLQYVAAE